MSGIFPKKVPWHPMTPSAIGRSNAEPSLRMSAGARLIVTAMRRGEIETAISQRGLDALAAFLHGNVRQADDVEAALIRGANVRLHFHEVGVNSKYRGAEGLEEHPKAEGLAQSEGQSVSQKATSSYRYSSYLRLLRGIRIITTRGPAVGRRPSKRGVDRSLGR